MENNPLVRLIEQDKRTAHKKHLESYMNYVAKLEEEVDKLREITRNPETELSRLREENINLQRKLATQNHYSFDSSQRAAAESWIQAHNEAHHENGYLDYSYVLTPTCLDSFYQCKCNKCGATQEL
jgi:hypothetical protein